MKKYYERYWKTQDILEDFDYKWPVIKKFIPTKKNIKILDFGCGKGKITQEIKKINTFSEIFGVDVSKTAIDTIKKRIKGKFRVIEDGGKLPYTTNFFDFIIASDVLEHIYDTQNAFEELARILKPNGKILISIPYNGLIKNFIIVLFFYEYIYDPYGPHIRFFTKKSLLNCLKDFKLKAKKIGYYGRFYPLSSGMYVLAQK